MGSPTWSPAPNGMDFSNVTANNPTIAPTPASLTIKPTSAESTTIAPTPDSTTGAPSPATSTLAPSPLEPSAFGELRLYSSGSEEEDLGLADGQIIDIGAEGWNFLLLAVITDLSASVSVVKFSIDGESTKGWEDDTEPFIFGPPVGGSPLLNSLATNGPHIIEATAEDSSGGILGVLRATLTIKNVPPQGPPIRKVFRQLQSTGSSGPTIDVIAGILESEFQGASGAIRFGKEDGQERNSEEVAIGLYNVRPGPVNPETGKRSYASTLVSEYLSTSGWVDVAAIIYRDGTTYTPQVVREVFNENFISSGIRAIGLVLMLVAWLIALTLFVLVTILRKDEVVKRAQPIFMQILCVGSIITSSTIFLLSWDEGAGWSEKDLDVACVLSPWFFFIGQILTFCALFTKLWRVDKVLQFRRRAVTISNVIKPLIAVMAIAIAILTAWTVVDPYHWSREVISELPAETYGRCTTNNWWAWFGPLTGLIFVSEAITSEYQIVGAPDDQRIFKSTQGPTMQAF